MQVKENNFSSLFFSFFDFFPNFLLTFLFYGDKYLFFDLLDEDKWKRSKNYWNNVYKIK